MNIFGNRSFLTLAIFCLSAFLPLSAFSDCGGVTKGLFGVEIGGTKNYLSGLPVGISLSPVKRDFGASGVDTISGRTHTLDLRQANVYWYDNRVVLVLATIQGGSEADIDNAQRIVLTMSGTDFNPKAIPANEFLLCKDGLTARIVRSKIFGPGNVVIPVLILGIENSKLKSEMEQKVRSPTR